MELEINSEFVDKQPVFKAPGGVTLLVTPPIGKGYWLYRVKVAEDQAIIGFPKFGTIGVGFEREDKDWNRNLPFTSEAKTIYDHISLNKGCDATEEECLQAIGMIQEAAKSR